MGTSGNDILHGTTGADHLYGAGGRDELYGGAGNDLLRAGQIYVSGAWRDDSAGDKLDGGAGDDELQGGAGDDVVLGGDGNDIVSGDAGHDVLEGGAGNDSLYGGLGNDKLDGGTGYDELFGDAGNDFYTVRDRHTVIYDTTGLNTGLIKGDFIKPAAGISWSWAEGAQKLPYWIDALTYSNIGGLGGALGADHTVHYAFAQQPASWFDAADRNQFSTFSAAQQAYTVQLLQYVSTLVDVNFVQTADVGKAYTIVFGNNEQSGSSGYAAPIYAGRATPLMLDHEPRLQDPKRDDGLQFATVTLHEIGHALHLKHPFSHADAGGDVGNGPYLPAAEDLKSLSIMSYTYDPGKFGYREFSPFDLAALHYIYGVAPTARAGDDRYVLNPHGMNMLWDGAGRDTIDGAALTHDLVLDLRPGYWGYIGEKSALISAAGQVTINFGTVIEAAIGGSGNDSLTGNDAGNVLTGGAGNDTLAGGGGIDTATYAGKRADYTVVRSGGSASVSGSEGQDALAGIERIRFADTTLALDTDGVGGQLFRMYQAAFDRRPDLEGLGFWIKAADDGMQLEKIAAEFANSTEFKTLYGSNPGDDVFLTALYNNVLHRKYDQDGFDFWLQALKSGVTREHVLVQFADSKENIGNVASLIAEGFEYIPYG
jgi:hypothetical protein